MKYLVLVLAIFIAGCASTKKVLIDSDLYTSSYDKTGNLVSKTKLNSIVLHPGTDKAGLILESSKPEVTGNRAYYSSLYVWGQHIDEFVGILEDILSKPIDQDTNVKTKLGADPARISTQVIDSKLYVIIFSFDGILGLERSDLVELIKLLKGVQNGAGAEQKK